MTLFCWKHQVLYSRSDSKSSPRLTSPTRSPCFSSDLSGHLPPALCSFLQAQRLLLLRKHVMQAPLPAGAWGLSDPSTRHVQSMGLLPHIIRILVKCHFSRTNLQRNSTSTFYSAVLLLQLIIWPYVWFLLLIPIPRSPPDPCSLNESRRCVPWSGGQGWFSKCWTNSRWIHWIPMIIPGKKSFPSPISETSKHKFNRNY